VVIKGMYLHVFFLSSVCMVIFVFSLFGCVRVQVFLLGGFVLHFFSVVYSGSVTGVQSRMVIVTWHCFFFLLLVIHPYFDMVL